MLFEMIPAHLEFFGGTATPIKAARCGANQVPDAAARRAGAVPARHFSEPLIAETGWYHAPIHCHRLFERNPCARSSKPLPLRASMALSCFEPTSSASGSKESCASKPLDWAWALTCTSRFATLRGMPDELFRRSLYRAERKFDVMQELGCPLMLVCSSTRPHRWAMPRTAAQAASSWPSAPAAATAHWLRGPGRSKWVNLYKQAWNIVEKADHPHLGLILGTFHPCRCATTDGHCRHSRRAYLLCADGRCAAAGHGRDPVGVTTATPGQGQLDVVTFFERRRALAGYTGNLSLEIFNDVFRKRPTAAPRWTRCARFVFGEQMQEPPGSPHAGPHRATRAPATRACSWLALPRRQSHQPLGGFSFIEFGVEIRAGGWRSTFTAPGFEHGPPPQQAVDLYCQGDISSSSTPSGGRSAPAF